MDRSQDTKSPIDELRVIRKEARQTRSLEKLRRQFARLQDVRRQHVDDFDLQIVVADIHQEIIERARYLRGESPARRLTEEETLSLFPEDLPMPPPAAQPLKAQAQLPRPHPSAEETPEAALIPPEVPRLDPKSWQIAVGLALFLTILALAAFFYLIQTARTINLKDEQRAAAPPTPSASSKTEASSPAAPSITPTLRLYTDLIPAIVTIDDQAPRDVRDGELLIDNLPLGQHLVKVAGRSGLASFQFEVTGKSAPRVVGTPVTSNAMAVLVSVENGQGRLVTNVEHSTVLVDGKPAGNSDVKGLALTNLGATDHDLQVTQDKDHQRFILTHSPAPVLTVYVKSDPSAGTLVVMTGQDGVDIYIDNALYRRKTEHGQARIPLQPGKYKIRVHKAGFADLPPSAIEIKKTEETELQFHLVAALDFATLQIKGALPGTSVVLDKELPVPVAGDGTGSLSNIKAGDHTIELRHELYVSKRFVKTFHNGDTVVLSAADLAMEKLPESKAPASDAPASEAAPTAAVTEPQPATVTTPPAPAPVEGERVQKGGGFVPYGTPRGSGRYSFQAQGRVGGFLKHGKLQWYAGYQDSQNYVLFVLDGKHASVREVREGKSIEWNRVPFSVESNQWIQVDLSIKSNAIESRVRTPDGAWSNIGTVNSNGRDFTQDRVGLYIPEKDEVAVANFHFASH